MTDVSKAMWGSQIEAGKIIMSLSRLSQAEKIQYIVIHQIINERTIADERVNVKQPHLDVAFPGSRAWTPG